LFMYVVVVVVDVGRRRGRRGKWLGHDGGGGENRRRLEAYRHYCAIQRRDQAQLAREAVERKVEVQDADASAQPVVESEAVVVVGSWGDTTRRRRR
jgi:hypothetical protein